LERKKKNSNNLFFVKMIIKLLFVPCLVLLLLHSSSVVQLCSAQGVSWSQYLANEQHVPYLSGTTNVCDNSTALFSRVKWISYPAEGDSPSPLSLSSEYLYAIVKNGANSGVQAYNKTTGALAWSQNFGSTTTEMIVIGEDDSFYVPYEDGMYGVFPNNTIKWVRDSGATVQSRAVALSTSLMGPELVFYSPGPGLLISRHSQDGSLVWSTSSGFNSSFSTPITYSSALEAIFVGDSLGRLNSFSSVTGNLLWSYNCGSPFTSWNAPAVYQESSNDASATVVVASGYSILSLNSTDGSLLGNFTIPSTTVANTTQGVFNNAPVIDYGYSGLIFVGSSNGIVYALFENLTLAWQYDTGDAIDQAPMIGPGGDELYVFSGMTAYAFSLWTGSLLWSYDLQYTVINGASGAIDYDGTIYVRVIVSDSNTSMIIALNPCQYNQTESPTPSPTLSPSISASVSISVSNSPSETVSSTPSPSPSMSVSQSLTTTPSLTNSPTLDLNTTSINVTSSMSPTPSPTRKIPSITITHAVHLSHSRNPPASSSVPPVVSPLPISSVVSSLTASEFPTAIAPSRSPKHQKIPTVKVASPSKTTTIDSSNVDVLQQKGCLTDPGGCPVSVFSAFFFFFLTSRHVNDTLSIMKVAPTKVKVTKVKNERNITIPIYGRKGVLWGEAIIPPHTFPPGCEIRVSQGKSEKTNLKDACGKTHQATPQSAQLNFTLTHCRLESNIFRNPIELRIIAKFLDVSKSNFLISILESLIDSLTTSYPTLALPSFINQTKTGNARTRLQCSNHTNRDRSTPPM